MSLLEKNLAALKIRNPQLAEMISSQEDIFAVSMSKSGFPIPDTTPVSIHSAYHPEREGKTFAGMNRHTSDRSLLVFGFAFGYHLMELSMQGHKLTVVEPSLSMLRSAFSSVDLAETLARIDLVTPNQLDIKSHADSIWIDHEPTARLYPALRKLLWSQQYTRSATARNNYRVMVVGPAYGGSAQTAQSCSRALESLGFTVHHEDHSGYENEYLNIARSTENNLQRGRLRTALTEYLGERTVTTANVFQPDIILALAQAPLSPNTLANLRAFNAPLIFWFVENHRVTPYWKSLAGCYDYFFHIQKGFTNLLENEGAVGVHYLPQAVDPLIHHPVRLSAREIKKYGAPLSFMGAGYPNRKKFFSELIDLPLTIWGTEWDLETPLGGRVRNKNRRLAPGEYVKVYNATDINLNLHSSISEVMIDPVADFINPRTFEIPACGGFQLVDERDGLADVLTPGEEIEIFRSITELREKIEYFINHPEKREAIAEAGGQKVLQNHTFVHRMAEMMSIVIPAEQERLDLKKRVNDVDTIIARATDSELKRYLSPFAGSGELSLDKICERIAIGSGPLTRPEAILLMMDQIAGRR